MEDHKDNLKEPFIARLEFNTEIRESEIHDIRNMFYDFEIRNDGRTIIVYSYPVYGIQDMHKGHYNFIEGFSKRAVITYKKL